VIEPWLKAVRDHPDRPPAAQCHALTMLALRMNWATGSGYASTGQLAADADVEERTIRRTTSWARKHGLLVQTRRGHRLGNGQVAASEWQISQPVTGDLLSSQPDNGHASTGLQGHLNRTAAHHHQELSPSGPSSSLRDPSERALADAGATEEEIREIVKKIKNNPAVRRAGAYLKAAIANGDAPALIDEARGQAARDREASSHPSAIPAARVCKRCGSGHHLTAECPV
jgi:hypothetical protein